MAAEYTPSANPGGPFAATSNSLQPFSPAATNSSRPNQEAPWTPNTTAPDQDALLVLTPLYLEEHLRLSLYAPGVLIVKNERAGTYLTVSAEQWQSLQRFRAGQTVPQVVLHNIAARTALPLREFYELVVKAHQAGILQARGETALTQRAAANWNFSVPPKLARLGAVLAILAGLASTCVRPMPTPEHAAWLLASWLLVAFAASAGNFLAACVASGSGVAVYAPRWKLGTPLPRFTVDLGDAKMGGRQTLLDTSLAQMAPAFLVLAATTWWLPQAAAGVFCAALALLSPLWRSPAWVMLRMSYAKLRLDTQQRFAFSLNHEASYRYLAQLKATDWRYVGIRAGFGVLWIALALGSATLFVEANFTELWTRYLAADGIHLTRLALEILAAALVTTIVCVAGWCAVQLLREARARRAKTPALPAPKALTPESVRDVLASSQLFGALSPEDRQALAAALVAEEYPANAVVIREGDAADKLYIVFSGQVDVQRTAPDGREETLATLGTTDVFGEVALLQNTPRLRTIRTRKKAVLLALPRDAFQSLLLSQVGRASIEHVVQKVRFLQRITFSQGWSPSALDSFARRAVFRSYQEGDWVVREAQDNGFFYLVYEGELSVRRQREEIRRLKTGDHFGEVSLMQNSEATASVVALTPVRCLVVSRNDFLQFLANEFTVGIRFEEKSSARLGREILQPRSGSSFDVIPS